MISATSEVELGFRAMLVHAPGLFRLDVTLRGDTLAVQVRNLSNGELRMGRASQAGYPLTSVVFGEAAELEPVHTRAEFTLGSGRDRVEVDVQIATLRPPDRGTSRFSAQAVVREAPIA